MASRTTAFEPSAAIAAVTAGLFLALAATAPLAAADPADPVAPPPPAPAVQADGADVAPPDVAPPYIAAPPNGIPHLASPESPPPGSTMEPQDSDSPNVSYLKDLWQAMQNHDISGKQALLMGIAQRGMNTPYPDQAPGPNVPTSPADPESVPPPALPVPVAAGSAPPPASPIPPDPAP